MTSSIGPVQEFTFEVSGAHVAGRAFSSEFLVIAGSEVEAREALGACLSYDPSISSSSPPTLRACGVPSEKSVADYERSGAFTVFDPDLGFLR
jgi:hypothetical protein